MSVSSHSSSSPEEDNGGVSLKGVLKKWTNYYYGWQERYVCCADRSLVYYRAQDEISFGCRGSISLTDATLTMDEFDSCRFDVTIDDYTWYFRSNDETERQQWIDVIKANSLERDRHVETGDRAMETRNNQSRDNQSDVRMKIEELKSFRGILSNQVDVLKRYFDACLKFANKSGFVDWLEERASGTPVDADSISFYDVKQQDSFELNKFDLKSEVLSFKMTTVGIETALNGFIKLLQEREEMWKSRCQELEQRVKSYEDSYNIIGDCDASDKAPRADDDSDDDDSYYEPNNNFNTASPAKHRFADQVEIKIKEHLEDSLQHPDPDNDQWELLTDERDLKLYRKELVENGIVCDPMKAVHQAEGVTARELCYYFWETQFRTEWDHTIEELKIVEDIDERTMIIHQVHKQVWPVTQRDCVYISTLLKVENPPNIGSKKDLRDTWMVCNFTVDHDKAALPPGRVRALVEVALVCQTFISPSSSRAPSRDDISCEVAYIANINPGGWAPVSIVRAIGKREYPKFLRNFTNFVKDKMKNQEIKD